ncbi:MAG: DNA gyrase subunit A [Clostridia bacterium]|nr:DNA gyrase subunit A [Clostridia bacterium]MDE7328589.1 DNA gyrase subunit A [Clostridia bacterium]
MEDKKDIFEMLDKTNVVDVDAISEMKTSFIAYAMAVNVSRAIPDVRDGLKPVHRRILYAMNELGLTSDKPYRKCALIVGDVLGKYHPHGDSSVYDALVRLAQDFSIRCTLVDGHGNFGSVDGDPAAAYRYTEARLSKIADEMIRGIDKKTVDFYPNFDDTREQPVVLPSRYPNLLVNGSDGIAVGMATSIPPHNLGEVIDGTIALLENPDLDIESLMDFIPAPDFPTGAYIMGGGAIKKAYRTGRGNCIIRAKAEIEENPNGGKSKITITEIPYQVNKAKLIENMADLVKQKRIEGIADIHELSDKEGMRIVIDVKKDANPQVVLNMLYKHTQLQISFSMIMLALVDGTPKILNLKEILQEYVKHQKSVITRRTQFDLDKALEREHILLGLVKALTNIDEVIETIKKSKDRQSAIENLTSRFELSDKQAVAILEMRLQRLTALEVEKIQEELAELEKVIADLRDILANPQRVVDIIKTELLEIKDKYNEPRRSEITYDYSDIDIEDLIEVEDVILSITHNGYIKRMPVDEYKAQRRGGVGVTAHKTKEEDFVENVITTSTHDNILFFSNKGKVYRAKGYQIPEASKGAKGRAIINLLNLEPGEVINAYVPVPKDSKGFLMMATKQGLIKKTTLDEFVRINANGKKAITFASEEDELIGVQLTRGDEDIILASSGGKCIRFAEEGVRATGRTSMGVKSIRLDKGEVVVDMAIVKEGCEVLTITENGYGKRTDLDEYRVQGRAGSGIKVGVLNDKTGNVVNLKLVNPATDDVMIIADNGIIIRVKADEISKIGRNTQGVKVMRMKDDKAKVVAFTIVPHQDEEEAPTATETAENAPQEQQGEQAVEQSGETQSEE